MDLEISYLEHRGYPKSLKCFFFKFQGRNYKMVIVEQIISATVSWHENAVNNNDFDSNDKACDKVCHTNYIYQVLLN